MYLCWKPSQISDSSGYQLLSIRKEDMEPIRKWRNAQIDVLRQKTPLSPQEQQDYFQTILLPSFSLLHPPQILLSYLLKGELIGYGGLVYIDWTAKRSEVSFLVHPDRAQNSSVYHQDFTHFLSLLMQIAFQDLEFHRLFTETYSFRKETISILEECGFQKEGILRDHVFKQGKWQDSVIHGILAQDFKK